MIDIIPPPDIEKKLNWLRELYPWSMLVGELIHLGDAMFGTPEFVQPIEKQDEEKASLQWFAVINRLYDLEKASIEAKKLLVSIL